ncbi:MAG TPA: hypothetical protein VK988_22250 [Acidimicrobiales bacterium]|nr:hypothetical protein [Acidimicrobiales bacterium]
MLHAALAAAATLVALAFSLCTFERWLARERPHDLAWSLALAAFALASGALWAGVSVGWDGLTFRLFYLFGAIVNVPALALGTVYLLGGRRRGHQWALAVLVLSAFAAGVVAVAPFTAPLPRDELARGSEVFGPLPRVLAAAASGIGALVIVLGAVWSAVRVRRARLVTANVLIAVGTLVTGASGLLNSVLDEMTGFAVALVVGISVIFAGFLVATTAGATTSQPPARAPAGRPAATRSRSATEDQELHQGRAQDEQEQDGHGDRDARPHSGGPRVTASPGPSRSSSAAERRSRARETSP